MEITMERTSRFVASYSGLVVLQRSKVMKPLKKFAACMGLALCATFNTAAQAQTQQTHAPAAVQATPAKPKAKPAAAKPSMTLRFYNIHTDESLTLTRHAGDTLPHDAAWFMRDYRDDKTVRMDPRLFDVLGRLQAQILKRYPGMTVTFNVVSSYRTSETNENLRNAGGSQARYSQHMRGRAMDISVPGVSTRELRNLATCLKAGGVGYYETDGFVHVDVARVRYWPSHDYLATLPCTQKPKVATTQKPRAAKRG
jgi:uncharacterized protein YcbK (DUF882 family)